MLLIGYKNTSELSALTAQAEKNITTRNRFDNEVFKGGQGELFHVVGHGANPPAGGVLVIKSMKLAFLQSSWNLNS